MAAAETRLKILDAAEVLFSQRGINGVSLREIAAAAEIRISNLQYHFRTKEDLYHAVFERRILAINADRIARLDTIDRTSGFDGAHLEDMVRAIVEPMVMTAADTTSGGQYYATLLSQVTNDPSDYARRISREFFDSIARITIKAFSQALPDLDMRSLPWAYIFAVAAMISAISRTDRARLLSDGACDPADYERTVSLLVPFIVGGMRAVEASERALRESGSANEAGKMHMDAGSDRDPTSPKPRKSPAAPAQRPLSRAKKARTA